MELSGIAATIAKYAPALGAVLPIPGGFALGQVVASLFGGDITKPDELIKRINADPEAALKLAQFEMQHKVELENLAIQNFQLEIQDKANARQREVSALQGGDKTTSRLALLFTSAYFFTSLCLLVLIYLNAIDKIELEMAKDIVKEMSLAQMLVLAYYFGASRH